MLQQCQLSLVPEMTESSGICYSCRIMWEAVAVAVAVACGQAVTGLVARHGQGVHAGKT